MRLEQTPLWIFEIVIIPKYVDDLTESLILPILLFTYSLGYI